MGRRVSGILRGLGVDFCGDLIGIQEFDAARGQKQTMECRLACPIAAGQNPELP
jgi:hypothetical protein